MAKMKIKFTKQSLRWCARYKINLSKLEYIISSLCNKEARIKNLYLRINIMPRAIHSFFDLYTNTLHVAVQSKAGAPRYIKIFRVSRNMLHELRHFIQYRILKKPFLLTYSYRDAQLINSNYLNDPDEIDARRYEKSKLKFCYSRLIK